MNKTDLERRGRALKLLCQCMNSRDAWNVEHAIYVSMAKSVFPDYEAKVRQSHGTCTPLPLCSNNMMFTHLCCWTIRNLHAEPKLKRGT